jgi:hypothetical protein
MWRLGRRPIYSGGDPIAELARASPRCERRRGNQLLVAGRPAVRDITRIGLGILDRTRNALFGLLIGCGVVASIAPLSVSLNDLERKLSYGYDDSSYTKYNFKTQNSVLLSG